MDSFAWTESLSRHLIEQGQERLAELMNAIPYHHYNEQGDMVEALVPEALALARPLNQPWLEIYFRHWLHSTRLTNCQGEALLGEVVSTYELAHQNQNLQCPQTVCTTQDLVGAYANVDGPGWATERMAACDEALARIDPSWSCYTCLAIEHANAQGDAGQAPDGVAYLDRQIQVQRQAGHDPGGAYVTAQASLMLLNGQGHAALDLLMQHADQLDENDERETLRRRLLQAHALALTGRAQEAVELLPEWDRLTTGQRLLWCRAATAAARADERFNRASLGQALAQLVEQLHQGGSHRLLIDMAIEQIVLAAARQALWLGELTLALANEHLAQLRDDLGASARLAEAAWVLRDARPPALPCPPAELPAWLDSEPAQALSPEVRLQRLQQACAEAPQDESLAMARAAALSAYGFTTEARRGIEALVRRQSESAALQNHWMGLCFEAGDGRALQAHAREIQAAHPALASWWQARWAFRQGQWQDVGPLVEDVLHHDPQALPAKRLWMEAAMALGEYPLAVTLGRDLLALESEPGRQAWELLIAATAAQQWDEVRRQAAALKMPPADGLDNGPIEEEWNAICLRCSHPDGSIDLVAVRTGPATARIIQPAPMGLPQSMGDWVVFKPAPLEESDPEDPDAGERLTVYPAPLHVLTTGDYGPSHMIDGVHPGEERMNALKEALKADGCAVWHYSGEGYRLFDPQAEDDPTDDTTAQEEDGDHEPPRPLPGVYLAVAAPAGVGTQALEARLTELCQGLTLTWIELAEAAGRPTQPHQQLREAYGM